MSAEALKSGGSCSSSSSNSEGRSTSAAQRILNEIEANLLECKVCFEKYCQHPRERRPRTLPCGHVMCYECALSVTHAHYLRLECPFCRRLCSVSEMTDCMTLMHLEEIVWRAPNPTLTWPPGGWRTRKSAVPAVVKLSDAFGGWGQLINPTGVAFFKKSGVVMVVHDGKKRMAIFSPKGKYLHGFGSKGCICYPLGVTVTRDGYIIITDAGDVSVKVFSSRGRNTLTVKNSFLLPWGIQTDGQNRILVTDAQAGTLTRLEVDFLKAVLLRSQILSASLSSPREIAVSETTGFVIVVEHLKESGDRSFSRTRLKLFNNKMQVVHQIDSFGSSLLAPFHLCVSAVAFDKEDNVFVADSSLKALLCLGKLKEFPSFRMVLSHGLLRPVALACGADNSLIVLDSGDHFVKIYRVC
ncbi:E3 ubiquitin-protein ligase NHLRC1-like [Erpetoichthys calabaricus]|uniref:E3 ubiquitin-protein ligase NHLRC1-like n=1 Tax=Erpetoichthys calabaricus TaxID=27687 RepID=UPI00109FEB43|nr:E3 ubiquitin-protein ligase NHLRC1-like [Erpetoichthys calabaricus]